jgi:hypothetical protein
MGCTSSANNITTGTARTDKGKNVLTGPAAAAVGSAVATPSRAGVDENIVPSQLSRLSSSEPHGVTCRASEEDEGDTGLIPRQQTQETWLSAEMSPRLAKENLALTEPFTASATSEYATDFGTLSLIDPADLELDIYYISSPNTPSETGPTARVCDDRLSATGSDVKGSERLAPPRSSFTVSMDSCMTDFLVSDCSESVCLSTGPTKIGHSDSNVSTLFAISGDADGNELNDGTLSAVMTVGSNIINSGTVMTPCCSGNYNNDVLGSSGTKEVIDFGNRTKVAH